jgi:hypothetical protein
MARHLSASRVYVMQCYSLHWLLHKLVVSGINVAKCLLRASHAQACSVDDAIDSNAKHTAAYWRLQYITRTQHKTV